LRNVTQRRQRRPRKQERTKAAMRLLMIQEVE